MGFVDWMRVAACSQNRVEVKHLPVVPPVVGQMCEAARKDGEVREAYGVHSISHFGSKILTELDYDKRLETGASSERLDT